MTAESALRMKLNWKPLLLALLAFLGSEACADTYSFEDAGGTMVFTDNPAKIPSQRVKVRRIPDGAPGARPVTSAASSQEPTAKPLPVRQEAPEVHRQNLFYNIGGYTFMDIRREINRRSPKRINNKLAIAWCGWQVKWHIHTREKNNHCEIASVDTKVAVSLTMPRWVNYASAGVGMKEAWDLYAGTVLAHEETHAGHGITAAHDIQRRLLDLGGGASCKSVKEEGELLAGRIVKEYRAKDVELDRVSGTDFDTITDVEIAGDKREGVLGRQYPARRNTPPR